MKTYYSNFNSIEVPFYNLREGGVDNAIRSRIPINEDLFLVNFAFNPGEIVYDVGAYIGTHSIQYALAGGIVYAFEPSINNFNRCRQNCHPFRQIRPFNVAAHEREYDVITPFKDCSNGTSPDIAQGIKYVVLPEFAKKNELKPPNFIKLDIEGMETIVLKTFVTWFVYNRPTVLVELHVSNNNIQRYDDNPHWLSKERGGFDFNTFRELGYIVFNRRGAKELILNESKDLNENLPPAYFCVPIEKHLQLLNTHSKLI
jgi:FkbM family methyltransferase